MNEIEREKLESYHEHLQFQLKVSRRLLDVCPPGDTDAAVEMRRPHANVVAAISMAIHELVQRFPELKK